MASALPGSPETAVDAFESYPADMLGHSMSMAMMHADDVASIALSPVSSTNAHHSSSSSMASLSPTPHTPCPPSLLASLPAGSVEKLSSLNSSIANNEAIASILLAPIERRVANACTNCAGSKVKCDNNRPCLRCRRIGIMSTCCDSERRRRSRKRTLVDMESDSRRFPANTQFVVTSVPTNAIPMRALPVAHPPAPVAVKAEVVLPASHEPKYILHSPPVTPAAVASVYATPVQPATTAATRPSVLTSPITASHPQSHMRYAPAATAASNIVQALPLHSAVAPDLAAYPQSSHRLHLSTRPTMTAHSTPVAPVNNTSGASNVTGGISISSLLSQFRFSLPTSLFRAFDAVVQQFHKWSDSISRLHQQNKPTSTVLTARDWLCDMIQQSLSHTVKREHSGVTVDDEHYWLLDQCSRVWPDELYRSDDQPSLSSHSRQHCQSLDDLLHHHIAVPTFIVGLSSLALLTGTVMVSESFAALLGYDFAELATMTNTVQDFLALRQHSDIAPLVPAFLTAITNRMDSYGHASGWKAKYGTLVQLVTQVRICYTEGGWPFALMGQCRLDAPDPVPVQPAHYSAQSHYDCATATAAGAIHHHHV